MLLYYITDRAQFGGDEQNRIRCLLEKTSEATLAAVDYIQLREKDLPARRLESIAREAVERVRACGGNTRILINSRADLALAVEADGVHLRSDDIAPSDVRKIWHMNRLTARPTIAVSCHSLAEVACASDNGADFAVFGPVFEKGDSVAAGLDNLRQACRCGIPVLALGGVTIENARKCIEAGASGIAGIRLFQQNRISDVVACLENARPRA